MQKPFWLVWNPERSAPQHMHDTLHSATHEAERLARQNQGETFIVLESVTALAVNRVQRTDLRPSLIHSRERS